MIQLGELNNLHTTTEIDTPTMSQEEVGVHLAELVSRYHQLEDGSAIGEEAAMHDIGVVARQIRMTRRLLEALIASA